MGDDKHDDTVKVDVDALRKIEEETEPADAKEKASEDHPAPHGAPREKDR